MRSVLLTVLFVSVAFSITVTQEDWSGGPNVQGPVSDWGNTFWDSDSINGNGIENLRLLTIPSTPIEHAIAGDFAGANSIYSTDMDGDGDADILGTGAICDNIVWWENTDGTGASWIEHTIDEAYDGASSVYSADVDGDGDTDVLGSSWECDDITWWENTDGTGTIWTRHNVDGDFDGASSVCSSDIDNDGDADILVAGNGAHIISWWENTDGSGLVWEEHEFSGVFFCACSVCPTDLDGDGDEDVLGAGANCDDIAWWETSDTAPGVVWTKHTVDEDFNGACSVYPTDIDGDGDIDVLGAGMLCDDIAWWENTDGIGTGWTEHIVDGDFHSAVSACSADLDGDGDADILGAAYLGDDITWWENVDGSGAIWIEHTVDEDFDGARSVCTADVDGDGYMDVLGAGSYCDDITWWNVVGYSPTGSLESSILDAGEVEEWDIFASSSQIPSLTSVGFQFRSSNDSSDMGAWSDTVFSSSTSLSEILADSTRYLQYKVILETTNSEISPELFDVTFSYSLIVAIDDCESSEVPQWSLHPLENPSRGLFSALISVPEGGLVELSVYDVSGRVVSEAVQNMPTGTHSVSFSGLAEGVYFCTMRAGDFSATERFVVIE